MPIEELIPTAILDLDLDHLPSVVDNLERYSSALALLRLWNRPVGQVAVPVVRGRINGLELRDAALQAAGWALRERWLDSYLGRDDIWPQIPRATLAVCTRDRPVDLGRCLDALARLPDDGQEVLVIDNCPSSDATERLVQERNDPRVRYVREPRPGLDIARNRALREARHQIVAFTDDDAAPDASWLRRLVGNFTDPRVMVATGLLMPLELETDAQEWFERLSSFNRGFRRRVFDGTVHYAQLVGQVGAGASMAVRRDLGERVGWFDEALDAGTLTRSGGDHELFSRVLAAGYKIVYEPAALSWHRHRRTWEELREVVYGYGVGVYARWTRTLLIERDLGVLKMALGWLRYDQLPALTASLGGRPGSAPIDLRLAELRGCLAGPGAYLEARQQLRARALIE